MGGKSKKVTVGYWYELGIHGGLGIGPIDAYLELRGGDKTAWSGVATHSQTIQINAPNLWGGEKDQGGIVGEMDLMFGEADQMPSARLARIFGPQQPAWRGVASVAFEGKWGAMNPYPQKGSHKIRKILAGWDGECWYPEKAAILMSGTPGVAPDPIGGFNHFGGVSEGQMATSTQSSLSWTGGAQARLAKSMLFVLEWDSAWTAANLPRRAIVRDKDTQDVIYDTEWVGEASMKSGLNAVLEAINRTDLQAPYHAGNTTSRVVNLAYIPRALECTQYTVRPAGAGLSFQNLLRLYIPAVPDSRLFGMNPAHALYYVRTHGEIGREPLANMNDASFRAAADRLYSEGFGITTEYAPSSESVEEFEQRICKLIGGSVSRSLVDGQYYLDLARGDYVLEDLPIIGDDDILDFKMQPSILDGAVNSISVKYFDPNKKESINTPPAQVLALIDAFGLIHQDVEYPEVPTAELATRLAERDVRLGATPTRAQELVVIPDAVRAIRPNQYFRLKSPKRRIAEMVCLLGEKQSGTLKSSSVKLVASEDTYSLPASAFVEVEPGVDTRPDPTAHPIAQQVALEAPYIELVQRIDRANLDVLAPDAGYVIAAADQPAAGGRNFVLAVADVTGTYNQDGIGEWCPVAVVAGDPLTDVIGRLEQSIAVASITHADSIAVGSAALWGGEIVRVDAVDTDAGVITLGRGCADTMPAEHAAGSQIWFYDDAGVSDLVEYAAGESVRVKLLTSTGMQILDTASALTITVPIVGRVGRPYPPARCAVNGTLYPAAPVAVTGNIVVTWASRDRDAQADQLFDALMPSITPAPLTRFGVRVLTGDLVPVTSREDVAGTTATIKLPAAGAYVIELYSLNDAGPSLQLFRVQVDLTLGSSPPTVAEIVATTWTRPEVIIDAGEIT
ncbi:hypothetical protein ACIPR8_07130 [Stenotrophomonas sp. LARHCG68]